MDDTLTPHKVLAQVAQAIPADLRADIIIVGSLAAAYQLLPDSAQAVRTKDVDGMVAPHARALQSATRVTDGLLSAGWLPQASPQYDLPGTAQTTSDRLAVVRLKPPGTDAWFLELLGAPPRVVPEANASGRGCSRLQTRGGHFELPSFAYLGLVQFEPTLSEFGLRVALPQTMALANLLHHPTIGSALMSQLFADRAIKRANKDLGRVVALAFLADRQDENALETWKPRWREALNTMAPDDAGRLLSQAPRGLQALLVSPPDIEQALHTVNNGLLSATPLSVDQFVIAMRRLLLAVA